MNRTLFWTTFATVRSGALWVLLKRSRGAGRVAGSGPGRAPVAAR